MTQIMHEESAFDLLAGVAKQAQWDMAKGDPKVAKDAAEFLAEWQAKFDDLERRADALINGKVAPKAQPAPEPAPSPFEGLTPERLDAWGVSTAWAGMTSAQMAELERKQAHRDRAARLGVDPRFLPEEN